MKTFIIAALAVAAAGFGVSSNVHASGALALAASSYRGGRIAAPPSAALGMEPLVRAAFLARLAMTSDAVARSAPGVADVCGAASSDVAKSRAGCARPVASLRVAP